MSDTLTSAATPPPVPAPPVTRTWVAAAIVAAICVAVVVGVALVIRTTTDPTSAPTVNTGPLHTHSGVIAGRTTTICDPAVAVASVDGRHGVAVVVNFPGPAIVELDVIGGDGRDVHLSQQVRRRDTGARFDVPQLHPVASISVTAQVTNTANIGTCEVLSPDLTGG